MQVDFTAEHLSRSLPGQNDLLHFEQINGCRIELKLKNHVSLNAIERCTVYFEPVAALPGDDFWLDAAVEHLRTINIPAMNSLGALYDLSEKEVVDLLNESLVDLDKESLH